MTTDEVKLDVDKWVADLIEDHNEVVKSRAFGPFVQRWFALPDAKFSFTHDAVGLDRAMLLWRHLLPAGTGEQAPRRVEQWPYKIEDQRVFTVRALERGGESRPGDPTAGGGPRTLYGYQETQFDDHQLISEMVILSAPQKPDVEIDPELAKTRQGRIFGQFADVFNEYFVSGNAELLAPWCAENLRMIINDTYYGMAAAAPFNRLAPSIRWELRGIERQNGRIKVELYLYDWGGLDMPCHWDIDATDDGKLREFLVTVDV